MTTTGLADAELDAMARDIIAAINPSGMLLRGATAYEQCTLASAWLERREREQHLIGEHIRVAAEYEKRGNTNGARQLRAVANLLGNLRQGIECKTVLPSPPGDAAEPSVPAANVCPTCYGTRWIAVRLGAEVDELRPCPTCKSEPAATPASAITEEQLDQLLRARWAKIDAEIASRPIPPLVLPEDTTPAPTRPTGVSDSDLSESDRDAIGGMGLRIPKTTTDNDADLLATIARVKELDARLIAREIDGRSAVYLSTSGPALADACERLLKRVAELEQERSDLHHQIEQLRHEYEQVFPDRPWDACPWEQRVLMLVSVLNGRVAALEADVIRMKKKCGEEVERHGVGHDSSYG